MRNDGLLTVQQAFPLPEKDWRVGIYVRPKYRTDRLYARFARLPAEKRRAKVTAVRLVDGVSMLVIMLPWGIEISKPADKWVTA